MPAAGATPPDDIDLSTLWGAILRSKVRLLVSVLVVGVVTFAVLSMMTPQYTSVSRILIGKSKTDPYFKPKGDRDSGPAVSERLDDRAVKSQVEIVGSRVLAATVAKDLRLATFPEFNSALPATDIPSRVLRLLGFGGPRPGQSEEDRVLEAYFERLKVYHVKDTRAITIEFSAADPKLAAAVANALAETYLRTQKKVAVKQTKGASEWLGAEVSKLRKAVAAAEKAAAEFRAKAGLHKDSRGNSTLDAQQLSDLNAELSRARVRKSEAEARAKLLRDMARSGTAESAPDILKSQIIQGLFQQRARLERQISELSATLLPAHPRMRQLSADLLGLKRQIRQAIGKIVASLEKEARVAGLRLESLQANLQKLKQRAADSGGAEVRLAALEREAKSKRELLESYLQRLSDANARKTLKSVNVDAEIYDRAVPASLRSFPKKGPITLLAMAATFLFGMGIIITRELLFGARGTAKTPLAGETQVPRQAEVTAQPNARPVSSVPQTARQQQMTSPSAPSIERFARLTSLTSVSKHLLARGQDRSGFRTIIVAQSIQSECSTEVLEIAAQLSLVGKRVLLLDWAPPGHELFKKCRMNLTSGLADLATGGAAFEDVIHCLPGKDIHIMCAGKNSERADTLKDTDRLNLIFDALDETYDHILATGPFTNARNLFTAMQGRFDAGLLISDEVGGGGGEPIAGFLGYDVPDLEVIQYVRSGARMPRSGRTGPSQLVEV